MKDGISYKDIATLSPKEKEQFFRYVNKQIANLDCKCTEAMKIRGSDNLCLEHRKAYWDGKVVEAMIKVEEIEALIKKRDKMDKTQEALELIKRYGSIDGGHHKQWVLDQVVRILTGEHYDKWVAECKAGQDGPHTYEWDVGIAP
jgi:hypothetical protein